MFYSLRFLLGVAEAGFFPGIILYLTYWYPSEHRVRMIALFMTAVPIAGVIGSPLSGWIMEAFAGVLGWAGWQWLFLIEAVPAIVMGVAVLVYLDNGIRSAKWLTEDEKRLLELKLAEDRATVAVHPSLSAVFADRRVWLLCAIYFCYVMGHYGLTFWLPVLVQTAGVEGTARIGFVTAVPYVVAVVVMLLVGHSADKRRERRWHTAVAMLVGALGLILSVAAGGPHHCCSREPVAGGCRCVQCGTRILGAADGVPRRRRRGGWASRPSIHSAISQALSARMRSAGSGISPRARRPACTR